MTNNCRAVYIPPNSSQKPVKMWNQDQKPWERTLRMQLLNTDPGDPAEAGAGSGSGSRCS